MNEEVSVTDNQKMLRAEETVFTREKPHTWLYNTKWSSLNYIHTSNII